MYSHIFNFLFIYVNKIGMYPFQLNTLGHTGYKLIKISSKKDSVFFFFFFLIISLFLFAQDRAPTCCLILQMTPRVQFFQRS